jgi:hypothetical protein
MFNEKAEWKLSFCIYQGVGGHRKLNDLFGGFVAKQALLG